MGALMRNLILGAAVALVAGSSPQHTVAEVGESGLARVDEREKEPAGGARVGGRRAQDAVAKSRAAESDARARFEVAKSEKSVADAQLKRSVAERDLLKKQYAPKDQLAQADQNILASQDRLKATDLKIAYLNQMIA